MSRYSDKVSKITKADLEELLRSFEDTWADTSDERLTSAEFYDLYRRGEIDSVFATAWATYYERWRAASATSPFVRDLAGALLTGR